MPPISWLRAVLALSTRATPNAPIRGEAGERGAGRRANLVFGSDRAGHWVQCEAPGAFNAALVEGLDALAAERVREHRQ